MENGQIMNSSAIQDSFMMKTLDGEETSKSHNDITTKRMKNRERQRRYRARKRLEADMKKASVTNQPRPPQVEVELYRHHNNYITPIPCKRNWKKDARRAHACKNLEETHNAAVISALPLNIESQTVCPAPGIMMGPPQERKIHSKNSVSLWSSETGKTKFGRRDWKAEARTSAITDRMGDIKDIASKLTIADRCHNQFLHDDPTVPTLTLAIIRKGGTDTGRALQVTTSSRTLFTSHNGGDPCI
ncbi:unnamed protein product [Dovyalis caffra]|uniref:BZIP domain-containing protein n=1 Tax=Dovyalis caffra TaxID=77055 RepID=A0AAV1SSK2_9ROSI|nr:unnamed protein product [Dovyalis caffra]